MKKAVALFLALVMCLSLAACVDYANEPEATRTWSSEAKSYLTALFDGAFYSFTVFDDKRIICSFNEDGTCLINGISGTWVAQPTEQWMSYNNQDIGLEPSKTDKYNVLLLELQITLDGEMQLIYVEITETQEVAVRYYDSHGLSSITIKISKNLAESPEKIEILLSTSPANFSGYTELKEEIKDVITVEITPENWSEYFEITEVESISWPESDAFGDMPENYLEDIRPFRSYYIQPKSEYKIFNSVETHFEVSANRYQIAYELDVENKNISYIGEPEFLDVWTEKVSCVDGIRNNPQRIGLDSCHPIRDNQLSVLSDFQVLRVAGDTTHTFLVLEE